MQKVKVYTDDNGSYIPTHVEIDGKPIDCCTHFEYKQSAGAVPAFTIETHSIPDLEVLADIQFQFTPKTVNDALRIVLSELKNGTNKIHKTGLYQTLIESIETTLMDETDITKCHKLAKIIADKIINNKI